MAMGKCMGCHSDAPILYKTGRPGKFRNHPSRQLRRRILAALRLASRIVVFGRMARIGALSGTTAAALITGLLLPVPGHAQSTCQTGTTTQSNIADGGSCIMGAYDPKTHDNKLGQARVTDGQTVTLTTNGAAIRMQKGEIGSVMQLVGDIDPATKTQHQLLLNNMTQAITVPDTITSSNISINTYRSTELVQQSLGDNRLAVGAGVDNRQYIDMRLGTASGTGSTLHVNIGKNGRADDPDNELVTQGVKQTNYVEANNGATVIWDSKNRIFWNANNTKYFAAGTQNASQKFTGKVTYRGSFTGLDGQVYNVNNLAELQAYNDRIIAQLKTGTLRSGNAGAQKIYEEAFNLAFSLSEVEIASQYSIDATDDTAKKIGTIYTMRVEGPGSKGIISKTGELQFSEAALSASNQGRLTIEAGGIVSGNFTAIFLDSGARGTNNGVISGGFFHNVATDGAGDKLAGLYLGQTVQATGQDTHFINNGIMNLGAAIGPNYSIQTSEGASAVNKGIMNVGVSNQPSGMITSMTGAIVAGGSFTNQGTLYIGRGAQYRLGVSEQTNDTAVSWPTFGIVLARTATGATITHGTALNEGTITIGSRSQKTIAMAAFDTSLGTITNKGTININGAAAGTPGQNIGMFIRNSLATLTNEGSINVNGINGVGLAVITENGVAAATTSGTINVNGGYDSTTGIRNYGVWAEGANAVANVQGTVNLNGKGAIGIHARAGGLVNISGKGSVNFVAGSNQIGFFAHGVGSTINNAATALDASQENTTLFRIEDGATLRSAAHLTTSGTGAIGINATGLNASVFLTGGALHVTGQKSTGFNVEGGATGRIEAGVMAKLTGKGAMLGLIDGQKYALDGQTVGGPRNASRLTNAATIHVDGSDATGFVARNWGHFVNEANIAMTGRNTTGVHVQADGIFTNRADINVASGTGVLLDGRNVGYENFNRIVASDGNAALELRNDAGLVITTGSYEGAGTAHAIHIGRAAGSLLLGAIELTSKGSGNALENGGDIARFGTVATIINVEGSGAGIRSAVSPRDGSSAKINVRGEKATGLRFEHADGKAATNRLYAGPGFDIDVSGKDARGMLVNTDGTAQIDARITVSGQDASGIELKNASHTLIGGQIDIASEGGSGLKVATSSRVVLTGRVTSASKASAIDLSAAAIGAQFVTTGTIAAANRDGLAILGSKGNDRVTIADGALTGIISMGGGNDDLQWIGGTIDGAIAMGDGDDTLTLQDLGNAQLAKLSHLDAGKPNGIDKRDVLTFSNVRYKGGTFSTDDLSKGVNLMGGWDVINLTNGTDWTLTDRLTLDDPAINIDRTSVLRAGNGVNPVISATGRMVELNNGGLIDLTNGDSGASDRLILEGIYRSQGGTVALQTTLGPDNSATDRLIINGGTMGTARLAVTNLGGKGAKTDEGIEVITVNGTSFGTFDLIGDYVLNGKGTVVAGAYAYQLHQGNRSGTEKNNWYLRTKWEEPEVIIPPVITPPEKHRYQAGAASYEAYPLALLALNSPATLQQRVGNRVWSGKANQLIVQGANPVGSPQPLVEADNALVNSNGVWGRIEGQYVHVAPQLSTSEMQFNQTLLRKQAGMDGKLAENEYGNLIGGLSVHYVHGKTATHAKFGNGEINTDGYGLGGSLTWYGENGFYLDSLAQATWYSSDLSSKLARRGLAGNNHGFGYAFSLEAGQRLAIDGQWSLTPQAQLSFSSVTFDAFTDTFRAPVSLTRGDSLRGRLAISLDHHSSWRDASGLTTGAHLYGIANLYGEFLDGSKVKLADVDFLTRQDRLWGGLGFGGSYDWRDDKYSLYGEGLVDSSLNNFSDSFRLKGNLGFKMKW